MKITKRTAIGVTLIVLIGLTSWGLADTLTEQQYIDAGKAEFPKGNYETAIYLFTAGLQLNPDNPGLYNDRGLCYLKEGSAGVDAYLRSDVEDAIADFDKAIELKSHQSFSPDAGKSVRLENTSKTLLIFIEVATGIDLGTDHFDENC